MRRLVSVLVALLATWLGLAIAEPTTAAHSPSVVTSPYVGHYRSVGVTTSTTERGPPSSRDLEITYDSLNPRSEGAAACTRSADTRAVSTYDYPTTLVQVAGVVDTIKRIAGGSAGTSASDELRRVAAKSAPEMASGLERTGSALSKSDALHRSVSWVVDNPAAQRFAIKGGDGVGRELYQLPGEVNGKSGVFEWIIDRSGSNPVINHQRFIPGGSVTGFPNQVVP